MRANVAIYSRLAVRFWSDEKVAHWSDDMKLAAIYILSNRQRTLEGIFLLPPEYIQADLGWSRKKVKAALRYLEDQGFIRCDPKTSVLLIRNALKYQKPEGDNVVLGAIRRIRDLPNSPLIQEFIALAKQHCLYDGATNSAREFCQRLERELSQRWGTSVRTSVVDERSEGHREGRSNSPSLPLPQPFPQPPAQALTQPLALPKSRSPEGNRERVVMEKDHEDEGEGALLVNRWFKKNRPEVLR